MEDYILKGGWSAPAPYGYNVKDTILSINEEESPIVDLVFYLYTEKLLGMRAIANDLNKRGIRTRKNKLWQAENIKYMLNNHMYIGDIINHKTESFDITRGTYKKIPEDEQIKVHNEALRIIENETWKKKDNILKKRNEKLKNREGYSNKHELSTLLYCQQCGHIYIRTKKHTRKNSNEKQYVWTCLGHNKYGDAKCKGRITLEDKRLMECIKEELEERKKYDDSYVLDLYKEEKEEQIKNIDINKLKLEQEEINVQIIALRTEKNKRLISNETFEEQLKLLNQKLKEIRENINKYSNIAEEIKRAKEEYRKQRDLIENIDFDKMDNSTLRKIFDRIIVIVKEINNQKYITLDFRYNFLDLIEEDIRSKKGERNCVRYYRGYNYSDPRCLFKDEFDESNRITRKLNGIQVYLSNGKRLF